MLGVAEKLVERGLAYEKLRSIYFDISKYDDYGKLSNVDLGKMRPGRTTDNDDYEKDSPVDFTLLKRSSLAELKRGVFFKSRWGNVRPSWHLECAAVSLKYFADGFDIHSSGSDIVFPHCENVRAIGEAATGHGMANYWINSELVMVKGKKMSRSLENYYTMEDLAARGYRGKEIRYFLLGSHYRKPLHFSFGALDTAGHTVRNLDNFVQRLIRLQPGSGLPEIDQYLYDLKQGFTGAMDDDLNISGALASLFDFINKVSRAESEGRLSAADRDHSLEALKKIDSVLGVIDFEEEVLSAEARKLLEARKGARERRDWAESDRLRERLAELGVTVQDTPEGTTWRKS
jgi:cysteinyl-tRNA synthetase